MLVLMKLEDKDRGKKREHTAENAFDIAQRAYLAHKTNKRSRLVRHPTVWKPNDEVLKLIDGKTEPDAINQIVRAWNRSIVKEVNDALDLLSKEAEARTNGDYLQYPANLYIHRLRKAVAELYDEFYDFGDHMLLLNGEDDVHTILQDKDAAHICEHPEQYVCITIHTKPR